VRVARAIADLPLVDDALHRGQLSYSKVRALTRVATPATEATLVEMARSSTASQLERICRGYRLALRNAAGERPEDEAERRWVRERETEAGLVRFEVQLRPDEAAVVRRALEAAMQRSWDAADVSAGTPPASLRRADALVAVAEQYLAGGTTAAAPPVEVVVHVDAAALAEPDAAGTLDDGTVLAPAATERLLCDATVGEVVEDCSVERSAFGIGAAAFRAARTATSTGTTSSRGPAAVPPRSRTCARSAGGITRTSTSTASAWRATAPTGCVSSGRMGAR
jgi:hypothetical protein